MFLFFHVRLRVSIKYFFYNCFYLNQLSFALSNLKDLLEEMVYDHCNLISGSKNCHFLFICS